MFLPEKGIIESQSMVEFRRPKPFIPSGKNSAASHFGKAFGYQIFAARPQENFIFPVDHLRPDAVPFPFGLPA